MADFKEKGPICQIDFRNPSQEHYHRYKNFSVQYDGTDKKLVETPPVIKSLASEHSITMNALTSNGKTLLRSRMNVDAVDLREEIEKRM